MKRDYSFRGRDFVVADYRARKNEYEKGLKYQLLIKVYDGLRSVDYHYRSTGYKGSTIKECIRFAEEYARWV